ncbi:MAG: hypothetical protein ABIQ84_10310 [Usitatibacter sp.]
MPTIEVDFEVFKAITARRPTEDVTENAVLRQLFGLPPARGGAAASPRPQPGDWTSKGVHFPQGTQFRASYKGQTHIAEVESGALVANGKRYDSPSAAAMSITRAPVNGWTFWEAKFPGRGTWEVIKGLRKG